MSQKFDDLLRTVLEQECGYKQPPFPARLVRTSKGEHWEAQAGALVSRDGSCRPLPNTPDGMAFDDDPYDTGGRTCMGVIQRVYDGHRRRKNLAPQDVWRISDDEIREIYRTQYYDPMRIDDLPPGLDLIAFDAGVNTGIGTGARHLQEVIGAEPDGHIGEATLSRAAYVDQEHACKLFTARRKRYYRQISTFHRFGSNWLRRADTINSIALARVADVPAVYPEPVRAPKAPPLPEKPDDRIDATTSIAVGGGGAASAASQVAEAVKNAPAGSGWAEVLLHATTQPLFWIGLATIAGAVFMWLRRRRVREVIGL